MLQDGSGELVGVEGALGPKLHVTSLLAVISLAAPHLGKYQLSTVMMLAELFFSRRKNESQLVYRSAMAR